MSFTHIVDKIRRSCARLKLSHPFPAAKTTLINFSILSIPIYYLSVYPNPESVLCEITKLVREFFLHKGSDQKDIHVVTWTRLIDTKPEEGLAIKNLVTAKHALMAKHVFKFLNVDDVIWVDILCVKYGNFNFWKDSIPYKCSCFFRGLCNSAKILKPYIGLTL